MGINHAYSFLLGRPCILVVGAVTSILHQKMKFVINNKLVIIFGEEDLIVSHLSSFRYIEADEDVLETSFQALEIPNATFEEVKESVEKVILSFASVKSTKTTIENGSPEGWGQVIDISMKKDCFGLGYKPSTKKGASVPTKYRMRRIKEVFLGVGYVYGDQVNTVGEDTGDEDMINLVYPCEATLTNWEAIEIPKDIPISK